MSETTGILDNSTEQVLILSDDKSIFRGNVKINGTLDVGLVRTTEVIADHRYEKKYLTFVSPEDSEIAGTGLLWFDKTQNKQLVFRANPDVFFLSEHIDIPSDKSYLIGGSPMLTVTTLGATVTSSNLRTVGTLEELTVGGDVNFNDNVFFNSNNKRVSIGRDDPNGLFSVYDDIHQVEIIIDGNELGNAKIGSYNSKDLDIVTGNQTRLTVGANGNITLGQENNSNPVIAAYGKMGVNVKNPKEDLEVAGNIKFQNKLFATGSSAPTEGSYQQGDIVWNTDPGISKYIGWVCTNAGYPGSWAPFGLIAG